MIMLVDLEVIVEFIDSVSKDSNLYFRGTGVTLMSSVFSDDFRFLLLIDHNDSPYFCDSP